MTFQHETEGDNFEEQILYGGAIHLMRACFNVMVENGYPPSFAYAKAIRSLRSVIDVMDENGIEDYLTSRCSRTCEFAVRTRGPRVINEDEIRKIFAETEAGVFARDWMQEFALGMPILHRLRRAAANSTMEKTGREWRRDFGK
jgi:ketol-acid reductoisomerase